MNTQTSAGIGAVQLCPLCRKSYTSGRHHKSSRRQGRRNRRAHHEYTASSFTRHVAYCRRTQHRRLHQRRPKACLACNTAKAKCSFQEPCARCSSKGLSCVYGRSGSHAPQASSPACIGLGLISSSAHRVSDPEALASPDISELFGDQSTLLDGFDDFSNITVDLPDDAFALTLTAPSTIGHTSKSLALSDDVVDLYTLDPALNDALYAIQNPDWLDTIPSPEPLGQQATHHILRALCGQMLRRETFPPFIHPHWHRTTMPESLVVCMHIARLFASRTADVAPFIWRTILAESRRVLELVSDFCPPQLQPGASCADAMDLFKATHTLCRKPLGCRASPAGIPDHASGRWRDHGHRVEP